VDNASPDHTAGLVQSEFPEVQLVRNDVNVGYARAVNQGFALADTPYVFLLNPDIRIPSAAVFRSLRECLEDNAAIAVAGPLQFKEGSRRRHLNFTWSYWTPEAFRIYLAYLLGRTPNHSRPVRVSFLNAGCLFVRRSAFDAVGRLNEKYFLYGEEPDLFFKLMRFGYECRLVPGAYVTHAREQSLRSVPSFRRLMFKAAGVRNIADAVTRGLAHLAADRLLRRKPS
jgi:GT2 family glycosyltransferase